MHEVGHVIYLKINKIEYETGINDVGQYFKLKNITKTQAVECALIGVLAGFIPFIFYFSPWLILLYLGGAWRDIMLIMGVKK